MASVAESLSAHTVDCPQCHHAIDPNSSYCSHCGYHLGDRGFALFRHRIWWKALLAGIVLYYLDMKSLAIFGNPNLIPTVIFLGSFIVPVTFVLYLYEIGALFDVPLVTVAMTFFYGGILGTLGAQYLEALLVGPMLILGVLAVGFSEELAKLLGVVWLLRRREYATELHGLVLGAASGMGFAAFESMGYAFVFLIQSRGNLDVLGEVILTRGLLSPLAHGTWTAIVAGVLWRERRNGRVRINGNVIKAFLAAMILHALWDLTAGILPVQLPGIGFQRGGVDVSLPALSLPVPSLVVGLIGLWILRRLFLESRAAPVVKPLAPPTLPVPAAR